MTETLEQINKKRGRIVLLPLLFSGMQEIHFVQSLNILRVGHFIELAQADVRNV